MDWINLAWLGLGAGSGLTSIWFWQKNRRLERQIAQFQSVARDQEALQARFKQLELAYQMATEMGQFKGGFLARTSHELRSPLNGLIGMHQLILSNLCDSPEEEREFLEQAGTSALKMIQVLDAILDVAKVQHGTATSRLQPVQLAPLFHDVHALTTLQARDRNIRLHILPPDPELYVLADPIRLQQVLVTLVDDAIQHMSEGKIQVSVQPSQVDNLVHIWIDDQRLASDRSEAIALLQTPPDPELTIPSPGMNLLTSQLLLQHMQGQLEILAVNPDDPTSPTRIQCSLAIVEKQEAEKL